MACDASPTGTILARIMEGRAAATEGGATRSAPVPEGDAPIRVLVVDDEPDVGRLTMRMIAADGAKVEVENDPARARQRLDDADRHWDVIVLDVGMPEISGVDLLHHHRALGHLSAVIMLTGDRTAGTAAACLRAGAFNYLTKPVEPQELTAIVRAAARYTTLRRQLTRAEQEGFVPDGDRLLVGRSAAMGRVQAAIDRLGKSSVSVLIAGESGTGKELVARALHRAGPRRDQPFVAINCGAIPEGLIDSELFGHQKGAFTGATQTRPGVFVEADQGTLFLDEIGEMPLPLQVKLLRVIEDKSVLPVGGTKALPVDTRIIASTNRDLEREVEAGRFREDLFYRLNVVHLLVPPLRERRGDIPVLVDHLVHRLNAKLGTHCLGVERDALWSLIGRPWKGNVRELENVLERAIVLGGNDLISMRDLSAEPASSQGVAPKDLRGAVRKFERQHLMEVLAASQSDKRKAARVLGISLASLYRKLRGEGDEAGPAFSK